MEASHCKQHLDLFGVYERSEGCHMCLIFLKTSLDHMFKGLCEFMGGSPLHYLVAIDLAQVKIWSF